MLTDLASISSLMVMRARRMNRGGCGRVGQDVDEVRIHVMIHVIAKEVKDAHPICKAAFNIKYSMSTCLDVMQTTQGSFIFFSGLLSHTTYQDLWG